MNNSKYISGLLALFCITLSNSIFSQISQPFGVVTDIVKAEGITDPSQLSTLSSANRLTTHEYVDGFGRPLQRIFLAASPASGKDLIQFYQYDEFGRSTQTYLPFAYTASSSPYQALTTAISNQATFYSTTGVQVATDTKPWAKVEIEQSPMQRLLKQGSVGDGFQTDQHYKSVTYRTNTIAADGYIQKWAADGSGNSTYSDNDLSVIEGADESGNKSFTFTDKVGRLVLKRQQADETINGTLYPYFDTYYVYDLIGNISYIIPPKAVVKMAAISGWNVTSAPNLTYHYVYDAKNRVIIKKVPNAANVYMVYDPLDRVVLVQDGNMRTNNKWYYTKYDNTGRTIVEGIYTDATHTTFNDGTSTDIQVYVNGLSCYSTSGTSYYETRATGTASFYSNVCFPLTGTEERIYSYYDDYDIDNNGTPDYSYTAQGMPGEQSSGATNKTLGLPTCVKKRIIGTSDWLISYTFYDKWYHPIQTISNNQLKLTAVTDVSTQVADIAGRVTATRKFKSHAISGGFSVTVNNTYTYDKMNRLLEVRQTNNSGAEVIVGHYEYNALGQQIVKKLHSTNSGTSYLQWVDYRYNIRGQLLRINKADLSMEWGIGLGETFDVFGMEFIYDQSSDISNTPNYTGLISGVKWKASPPAGGNTDQRSYIFTYDKLSRLKDATYKALTGVNWTKDVNGFDENMTYDWNGNIMTLKRKAIVSGYSGPQLIDDLSYTYVGSNDNNQLQSVTENSTNANKGLGFSSLSSSSYAYDNNGNLITDPKKGTTISYNELNKPVQILNSSSQAINYEYDASGARISKTTVLGGVAVKLYYIDGFVFDGSNLYKLSYFQMPEGRVRVKGSVFTFEYFITDNQGNVRVSFEDNSGTAVVRQENSYYPFGMTMPGAYIPAQPNKNLYNASSAWQDDYGTANYYSTFFREYDPILGRFNSVDPRSDATDQLSGYHFAINNPVNFNDPLGLLAIPEPGTSAGNVLQWIFNNWNQVSSGQYTFTDGQLTNYTSIDQSFAETQFNLLASLINGSKPAGGGRFVPGGLKVTGSSAVVQEFVSLSTDAMGAINTLLIIDGQVYLLQLSQRPMNAQQQAFYDIMAEATDQSKALVTIGLVERSEVVLFGSYALQQIDVNDMRNAGSIGFGLLAHEIKEQVLKQRGGDVTNLLYFVNHTLAIDNAEDKVNGYKREMFDHSQNNFISAKRFGRTFTMSTLSVVDSRMVLLPNGQTIPAQILSGTYFVNYWISGQKFSWGVSITRGNIEVLINGLTN